MVVISIVVAPSLCCVTAPLWRGDAGSGSHPPHLLSAEHSCRGGDRVGRKAEQQVIAASDRAATPARGRELGCRTDCTCSGQMHTVGSSSGPGELAAREE